MKICVIPDVHGSHHWEKIVPKKDNYDKIVFMGDYFDEWTNVWPDQMMNFCKILKFKKDYDKVDILWGNHDTSYFLKEHCSGFQPLHKIEICSMLNRNQFHLRSIVEYDGWLFAHGGVSEQWMKKCGIKDIHNINNLFMERPNFFRWVGPNSFGNNLAEGPFWIRPEALIKTAVAGYNQVLGHTELSDSPKSLKSDNDTTLLFIDSNNHDHIIELETTTNDFKLI
jgi:predicted MPP superfamily phosphohydrolase